MPEQHPQLTFEAVNRGFSKQSVIYDEQDSKNRILQDMRQQVYEHVSGFLKSDSRILELNAGTGIDALYFAQHGHQVHATDLSDGMVMQIREKIKKHALQNQLTCQQLSFDRLDKLAGSKFDYVFSNFGGLNCIDNLSKVTLHLPELLNANACVTWVIMPPVYPYELLGIMKGQATKAFRRFNKNGVLANVEGEYFKTYYHSLSQIKKAFGPAFKLIKAEGLCALSPPPSKNNFPEKYPGIYKMLRMMDTKVRFRFPFNRWADHIIVTFQRC